ncbi:MAG: hypothetical protein AB8B97_28240 [Granulosicoccus sp.]
MKRKILVTVVLSVPALFLFSMKSGLGGPASALIKTEVKASLSDFIEVTQLTITRSPIFVLSADQLVEYSADAVITEDYVKRMNPFEWQDQCEGGRKGRTANKALANTAVYEVVASSGTTLTLIGRMKAYKKEGQWLFTARNSRLMNNETRMSGTPLSTLNNVLLTQSDAFDQLCQSVFEN